MSKGRLIICTKAGIFEFPYTGNIDEYFQLSEQVEALVQGLTR
jgi:hypothetical protein